ncbi:MAG: flavin reductase family protein [Myxococcota bacterium]
MTNGDVAPRSVNAAEFKSALRAWASGVTILTARAEGRIHGMTVSAFSSVSVEPPLVLVCANRSSTTHELIQAGQVFGVNVLRADQSELSTRFSTVEGAERFAGVPHRSGARGVPLLDGALVQFECEVRSEHHEGTHTVYIGEVTRAHVFEGEPLLYFDGDYATLVRS